jgi:hypothetical protein
MVVLALNSWSDAMIWTFAFGVVFTMANYGKAPGFIKHIEVGTGDLRTISRDRPQYDSVAVNISDLYFPQMKMDDVRGTRASVTVPRYGMPVVFQRVHYTDIFGNDHYSGSIHRVFIVPHRGQYLIGDEPVLPGSRYWDWDKEKKT